MPEPTPQPTVESLSAELATLRQAHTEVLAKRQNDKTRITELESTVAGLQAKATEAETRIKQLTIDGPVNALCESISIAPQALRNALETDYRFELRGGVMTILNASDNQPVMVNGKQLPFQTDTIKSFLLESKDEAKLKLYRAIVVANRASGSGAGLSQSQRTAAPAKRVQFGLR